MDIDEGWFIAFFTFGIFLLGMGLGIVFGSGMTVEWFIGCIPFFVGGLLSCGYAYTWIRRE